MSLQMTAHLVTAGLFCAMPIVTALKELAVCKARRQEKPMSQLLHEGEQDKYCLRNTSLKKQTQTTRVQTLERAHTAGKN